eukprot:COSAG06_NODE_253_length_19061_cov_33.083114_18_plen_108_part_00
MYLIITMIFDELKLYFLRVGGSGRTKSARAAAHSLAAPAVVGVVVVLWRTHTDSESRSESKRSSRTTGRTCGSVSTGRHAAVLLSEKNGQKKRYLRFIIITKVPKIK